MPALIGVSEFVEECSADYKSPITSTFVSRMNNMRQTISTLEEVSQISRRIFPLFWVFGRRRSIIEV
jgi:hypothetical protein